MVTLKNGETPTAGHYPKWDANFNLVAGDSGGGGGGSGAGFWTVTDPPTTGWTEVNIGSGSVDYGSSSSSVVVEMPASGSYTLSGIVRSFPSGGTWKARMLVTAHVGATGSILGGICLRESGTGKLAVYGWGSTGQFIGQTYTNPTTFAGNYSISTLGHQIVQPAWFEIDWQATNRLINRSLDNFRTASSSRKLHSVAKNDGSTTAFDQYGIIVGDSSNLSYAIGVHSLVEL